jgi:CubicO group peptidase (beta-lactamase class C family)
MKSRLWWVMGLLVLAAVALVVAGGGSPRRVFTGIISGTGALTYLPPRQEFPVLPGPPQPTLTLAEAGVDPGSLEVAMRYAETRNTTALVVGLNGHVVYEKYFGDASLDSPAELSEFTPVLAALVLGTALQNGELRDLDAPVSAYFREWAQDPRGTITLRELLTGNSNLAPPGARTWPGSLAARYYVQQNLGANLFGWPLAAQPSPAGSPPEVDADFLALLLQRALGRSYGELLVERVWQPLGAGPFSMGIDGHTSSMQHQRAGCCLRARIGDWLRVGALIANRGVFEGNQLLPPNYSALLVTPTHEDSPRGIFLRVDGQFAARDVVRLEAAGKQRMWMVPSLKLVILRLGAEPPASAGWDEAMIPDSIIRGTRGWEPAGPGTGDRVDPSQYAPH